MFVVASVRIYKLCAVLERHIRTHSFNKPGAVVFLLWTDGYITLPPLVCRVISPIFVESISTILFKILIYSTHNCGFLHQCWVLHLQRVPDASRPSICKDLSLGIGERKVKEKGEYDMRQRG